MKKMMKTIMAILVATVTIVQGMIPSAASDGARDTKKILMVISGNGKDGGKTAPGYEFDELSAAYLVFKNNGLDVDVASPQGGKVAADPFDPKAPLNAQVLADNVMMEKLENSLSLASVKAVNYQAIFVVGGKGAMFDLHDNKNLQAVIRDIYMDKGIVSAVCHGPAALVNVQLPNGQYLVSGKRVNGFTNTEEKLFGKKWMKDFSFMLEDKLIARGGRFQSSPMMLSHMAKDGRLITGQNPMSTAKVAEEVVKSLGITPVAREKQQDELTLEFVYDVLRKGPVFAATYQDKKDQFNGGLISMYGYYYAMGAEKVADHQAAITLMSIPTETAKHPQLRLQLAKSWHKLGDSNQAKAVVSDILAAKPDYKPAQDLMKALEE